MNLEALKAWIEPAAILAVAIVLGFLFKRFFVHRMTVLSQRTKTNLDDALVQASKSHIPFWFLLGGVSLAMRHAPLAPDSTLAVEVDPYLRDALILSLSLVTSNFVNGLIVASTARVAEGSIASSSLLRNVARGLIVVVGLLFIVHKHTDITPILGALGIGSLAVALALQPTLSNLFAGLHITLTRPMRIGDFVELENGTQGFIVDIGWRATRLREPANDLVIVPNARLVEMIAKNYSMPDPAQNFSVTVGVSYDSDLERVEAVALEVARDVQETVPEAVRGFAPAVRFTAFGPSSIDFLAVMRVRYYPDRGMLAHEFIKRLKARFDHEGIEIPFPQQVVHQSEARAQPKGRKEDAARAPRVS